MIAPNKVYILPSQYNLQYDNGGEEYIRKDAILEWANGMMDCFAPGGDCSQTLQMVIKHIESL